MATKKPKSNHWTTRELNAVPPEWKGDMLSDGGSLVGKVKVSNNPGSKVPTVKIEWNYGFKWQGKKQWFYCGVFPNKSIKEIREARDHARQLLKDGFDPRLEREVIKIKNAEEQKAVLAREEQRKADAITIQDLFNHWIIDGIQRKDGNKSIIAMFNNHLLPHLGNQLISELTETQLIDVYKKLSSAEKYRTLEELHKSLKTMFKWGEQRKPYRKLLIEGNPVNLVTLPTLLPIGYQSLRERTLSEQELIKLIYAFKNNPVSEKIQIAVLLCLACTCRIGELTMAKWQHIDFENKTWFIPKENIKGKEGRKTDHTVYLSNFALNKLIRLKTLAGDDPWCFPSRGSHMQGKSVSKMIGDKQLMFMQRKKEFKKRRQNNDLVIGDEKWTTHDCRRTGASMIQALYPNTEDGILVADLCLNHKVIKGVAQHYLLHKYKDQMRLAWSLLGEELAKIVSNTP